MQICYFSTCEREFLWGGRTISFVGSRIQQRLGEDVKEYKVG